MTFNVIATGSDGNATIIDDSIVVDIGVPFKALKHHYKRFQLVLLTHIHSDHFNPATVKRLALERPMLRWACCEWMVEPLLDAGVYRKKIDVLTPDTTFAHNVGVSITPFRTPHNVPNCAWRIETPNGTAFYATDCGTLDGITAKDCDVYFVEANHVASELERRAARKLDAGQFAYEIRAAENHLSQEQAVAWLAENMNPNSIWVPMHPHRERTADEQSTTDGPSDEGP
jgi:phosphoribosyl 1,2-cyclic phosphodiesterase